MNEDILKTVLELEGLIYAHRKADCAEKSADIEKLISEKIQLLASADLIEKAPGERIFPTQEYIMDTIEEEDGIDDENEKCHYHIELTDEDEEEEEDEIASSVGFEQKEDAD